MLTIKISIRNPKTCHTWAKVVEDVDLSRPGGYALIGEWLPHVRHEGNDVYVIDVPNGTIVAVGYIGGSHKNKEQWCALVRASDGHTSSARGVAYGEIVVEGGEIVFFASSYNLRYAEELAKKGYNLRLLRNPNYAAAAAVDSETLV